MAKVITFFNNKGGVSKTTTCFNVGWKLAELGKKVILVDADPQCNLSGMVLELRGEDALAEFYKANPNQNLKDALQPAFASRPIALKPVDCVAVESRPGLFLIPGHVGLAEDEVSLGIAQQLSESIQTLRNLPGSFRWLFDITAAAYDADYVLVDLSPGLGSLNQNLVSTADYFVMPASPDVFSVMAMESLAKIIPRWMRWARSASDLEALKSADYPFKPPTLKFLGLVVQRYRLRGGRPTRAFKIYFDELNSAMSDVLLPALRAAEVLLDGESYKNGDEEGAMLLASIPDFNTLIASSQQVRKPVYALVQDDVNRSGFAWDSAEENIIAFNELFENLAKRIISLTSQ